MRTSPRVVEVELPGGEVILCRPNGVVQGIIAEAVAQAQAAHGEVDGPLVAAALLPALLRGFREMVASGAFVGWRNVLNPNGSDRRFVAGELDDLLEFDEKQQVVMELVGAAMESARTDAAVAEGLPDPTAPPPAQT